MPINSQKDAYFLRETPGQKSVKNFQINGSKRSHGHSCDRVTQTPQSYFVILRPIIHLFYFKVHFEVFLLHLFA